MCFCPQQEGGGKVATSVKKEKEGSLPAERGAMPAYPSSQFSFPGGTSQNHTKKWAGKKRKKSEEIASLRESVSPARKKKQKSKKKYESPGWYYYNKGTKLQGKDPVCVSCGMVVNRKQEARFRYAEYYDAPRTGKILKKTLSIHCKMTCMSMLEQPNELKKCKSIQEKLLYCKDRHWVNKEEWPNIEEDKEFAKLMKDAREIVRL